MKLKASILAIITISSSLGLLLHAQAQSPLTPPPAQTGPQALVTTPEMRANQFAIQSSGQVNSLFSAILAARTTGIPARGSLPAVTPAQVDAAFGAANVAKLQAAAAVLLPSPTPTPTP